MTEYAKRKAAADRARIVFAIVGSVLIGLSMLQFTLMSNEELRLRDDVWMVNRVVNKDSVYKKVGLPANAPQNESSKASALMERQLERERRKQALLQAQAKENYVEKEKLPARKNGIVMAAPPTYQKTNGGAFVHMGKTGGSTLSLLLRNGCHSFMRHPCRHVANETMASKQILSYYHVPDFAFLQQSHHDFYFITTRDPLDRLVSAFTYQHVRNVNARNETTTKTTTTTLKHDQKYRLAFECFPTLETFVSFLFPDPFDYTYNYYKRYVVTHPCENFARAVINGRVRCLTHMFFGYRKVVGFIPDLANQTIFVSRQENLWQDWQRVNQLLGQTDSVLVPDETANDWNARKVSIVLPVTRELSRNGTHILCHALEREYDAYFWLLRHAKNINDEEYATIVQRTRTKCPNLQIDYEHPVFVPAEPEIPIDG
jgi:hypothetical protein